MNKFYMEAGLTQRDLHMAVQAALLLATRYEEIAKMLSDFKIDGEEEDVELEAFQAAAKIARQLIATINKGRLS